ncbi:MAG: exo-alpha-sialidase [Parcubacteria group bacterium]|nr:exo-alpha-sialidase [Parcubacteria group bacterium]
MSKLLTPLLILTAGLLLLGAGCEKEETSTSEPEQAQEQTEQVEEEEDLAVTAKQDFEENRAQQKDCQRYNWPNREGPYNNKISYATGTDLLSWTDSEETIAEHASVPGAVYRDGIIYVYFVDVSEECYPEALGLIKSTDNGATWSAKETAYIKDLGTKVTADPAPILLDDGRIRIYYFDISATPEPGEDFKIYSAISQDGVNFIQEDGIRFSNPGTLDPDVIKVGATWRLYTGDIENDSTISATSTDGLNFTKEGTAFSGGAVPDVFYQDDTYYLYTAGINIATSPDGKSFTDTGKSFRTQMGVITADPSVIELDDESYLMLYKYQEGAPQGPGPGEPGGPQPPPPLPVN